MCSTFIIRFIILNLPNVESVTALSRTTGMATMTTGRTSVAPVAVNGTQTFKGAQLVLLGGGGGGRVEQEVSLLWGVLAGKQEVSLVWGVVGAVILLLVAFACFLWSLKGDTPVDSKRTGLKAGSKVESMDGEGEVDLEGQGGHGESAVDAENKEEKKSLFTSMSEFLGLLMDDWQILLMGCCFLIIAAILEAMIPMFLGQAVTQTILFAEGKDESAAIHTSIMLLLGVSLGAAYASSCRGACFIWLGGRSSRSLRQRLFEQLLRQDIAFYDSMKTGDLTSRLTQDCTKVTDTLQMQVNVLLRTVIQIITMVVFMAFISVKLTAVAFVSTPVVVYISKKYGNFIEKIMRESQDALAEANGMASEGLANMRTVRSFSGEQHEASRFSRLLEEFVYRQKLWARTYIFQYSTVYMLPNLVAIVCVVYAVDLVKSKELHAHDLVAFMLYVQTLNVAFASVGDIATNFQSSLGAGTQVFKLLEREPVGPTTESREVRSDEMAGRVVFRNVSFQYPIRARLILDQVSFEISPKTVAAFVGPSGGGKSTIIALLKRFYQPFEGTVELDGQDINTMDHIALHRTVSLVAQEPVLFDRTIRDNILYGYPEGRVEVAIEAAQASLAHGFIMKLPNGYDTIAGENGVKLSGGERQRIAIARALVRRPRVLLLDEATSALDTESEHQVQASIDAMMAREDAMTVVIVAHRLTTVQNANCVFVIENGHIVEKGPPKELSQTGGVFASLLKSQVFVAASKTSESA